LFGFLAGFALFVVVVKGQQLLWEAFVGESRPGWVNPVRLGLAFTPVLVVGTLIAHRVVTRRRRAWIGFCLGAAAPWVLTLLFLLSPFGADVIRGMAAQREFNSTAWKAAAWSRRAATRATTRGDSWPPEDRLLMIADLIAAQRLDGRSREEVRNLLGPPDGAEGTGYGKGYFRGWGSVYYLGPERGMFGIDAEWLVINYDHVGRVSAYRIVHD